MKSWTAYLLLCPLSSDESKSNYSRVKVLASALHVHAKLGPQVSRPGGSTLIVLRGSSIRLPAGCTGNGFRWRKAYGFVTYEQTRDRYFAVRDVRGADLPSSFG